MPILQPASVLYGDRICGFFHLLLLFCQHGDLEKAYPFVLGIHVFTIVWTWTWEMTQLAKADTITSRILLDAAPLVENHDFSFAPQCL